MIPFLCTLVMIGGCLLLLGIRAPRTHMPLRVRPLHALHALHAIGAALLGASLALIATGLPVAAVLSFLAAGCVPSVLRRRHRSRVRRARLASWPVLLDDVTSAVRAGMNLPEALVRAGANSSMPDDFAIFAGDYRRTGDFAAAVLALRQRIDEPVFDQLAQALIVTREVGGTDLTGVLRALGVFVRSEIQLRGELEARQSWTVNSARMAVAAPWVVLVLLCSRPATIAAYSQMAGILLLVIVAGFSAIAYAVMLRIARLTEVAA